jgi:hypothetical protein
VLCFIRSGQGLGRFRAAYLDHRESRGVLRWKTALGRKELRLQRLEAPVQGLFLDMIEMTSEAGDPVSVYLTKDWGEYYRNAPLGAGAART